MLKKIVSGGQTGADRVALDVALEYGFEIGGWVPKGRLAEDGPISCITQDSSRPIPLILPSEPPLTFGTPTQH